MKVFSMNACPFWQRSVQEVISEIVEKHNNPVWAYFGLYRFYISFALGFGQNLAVSCLTSESMADAASPTIGKTNKDFAFISGTANI